MGPSCRPLHFAGPGNIEESEELSQKARKALGEGATPEFKDEWKRHLSYITFARLDAHAFVKAEQSLKAYLEIEQIEDILIQVERPDAWGYALLARFFRQTKDHPLREKFYQWVEPMFDNIKMNTHPWQLFAYNTGQIAHSLGHIDDAVKLMNRSINICFSDHFSLTMRVMALLPISMLVYYRKETKGIWEKDIRAAAKKLDADHFSFLKKADFQIILEKVRECPGRIFPFTYR